MLANSSHVSIHDLATFVIFSFLSFATPGDLQCYCNKMKLQLFILQDQTVRLIYSYHPDDPDSETSLPYHEFERRGTKSVSLLSISQPPASLNDLKIIEFRNRNVRK